jgi:hypothetical protein
MIHGEELAVAETPELRHFEHEAGIHSNNGGTHGGDMVDETQCSYNI